MKRGVLVFLAAFSILLIAVISMGDINAYDVTPGEMVVGVNVLGYEGDYIRIQVPDYISLGEVSKNYPLSDEIKIRVNNTGTIDAIVTPELVSGSNPIFDYTFFRKQTQTSTNNTYLIEFHRIGDYNINVDKKDYETFYVSMNLSDYNGTWPTENLDLNTTIRFNAMSAE